jgi:hypothetical protein
MGETQWEDARDGPLTIDASFHGSAKREMSAGVVGQRFPEGDQIALFLRRQIDGHDQRALFGLSRLAAQGRS